MIEGNQSRASISRCEKKVTLGRKGGGDRRRKGGSDAEVSKFVSKLSSGAARRAILVLALPCPLETLLLEILKHFQVESEAAQDFSAVFSYF